MSTPALSSEDLRALVGLRRELHRRPELAHNEEQTARGVVKGLNRCSPDRLVTDVGGHGLLAIFDGPAAGPTVLVRCELDALPIQELSEIGWRSCAAGIAHSCGHDGHMAILAGLATVLGRHRPARGRVALLFQPAEEVGEGARRVLADPALQSLRPDRVFALHNLPGFARGEVVLRAGPFASASRGLVARLEGKTSHAGQPQLGRSPALALARAIEGLTAIPRDRTRFADSALITVVGARLGSRAFGTSPGEAELYATLRAQRDETVKSLWDRSVALIQELAAKEELTADIQYTEDFPATINDPASLAVVERAAAELGVAVRHMERPFPWSEDFGHFTGRFPGCLFGLGAGTSHPALHNPDYDFPDELIEEGVDLLVRIVRGALESTFEPPAGADELPQR